MESKKEFMLSFKGSKKGSRLVGRVYLIMKAKDETELKTKLAEKYDKIEYLQILSQK